MIQKQSLATFILLTIVTCGIYSFVWIYNITVEMNKIAENAGAPANLIDNPSTEILLCLVTCGIYTYIWFYKQGNKMKLIANEKDITVSEDGSSYILFMLLGMISCGIFTFYAYHLFIKNYNLLVDDYNSMI